MILIKISLWSTRSQSGPTFCGYNKVRQPPPTSQSGAAGKILSFRVSRLSIVRATVLLWPTQLSNFEARFPFSLSICWSFGVIALIICSYTWRGTDIDIPYKTFQINISENLASLVKHLNSLSSSVTRATFQLVTSVRYFEPDRPYHLKFSPNLLNFYSKQQMFKQSQPWFWWLCCHQGFDHWSQNSQQDISCFNVYLPTVSMICLSMLPVSHRQIYYWRFQQKRNLFLLFQVRR